MTTFKSADPILLNTFNEYLHSLNDVKETMIDIIPPKCRVINPIFIVDEFPNTQVDKVGVLIFNKLIKIEHPCFEVNYSGSISNDVISLLKKGLFGLFYYDNNGEYTLFSVGFKLPYIPTIGVNAIRSIELDELEGLDIVESVGYNIFIR